MSSVHSCIRLTRVLISIDVYLNSAYSPEPSYYLFLRKGSLTINYYPHHGLFYSRDMYSEHPLLSLYHVHLADLLIWYLLNVCFVYQFMGSKATRTCL